MNRGRRRCLLMLAALPVPLGAAASADARTPNQETHMDRADKASRPPPPKVAPVVVEGVQYAQVTNTARAGLAPGGGWLAASDAKTGKPLWTLRIYDNPINPADEADVQLVFFTSMKRVRGQRVLEIENENGERYTVDLDTRDVVPKR